MFSTILGQARPRHLLAAAFLSPALLFGLSSPASAADFGGNGNPATSCSNAYTVKSAPLVGSRGPTRGKVVGVLQLRWSWTCHGNWSRVVLYGNSGYSDTVNVEQIVESEGRRAGANDWIRPGSSGASSWTPFIRLANSQSTACVQAWASSDFNTLNYHTIGARVCA
ncbi:hypothetical protein [Nocardioides bruguierae]|uniref:DUF2690 domain-containing protein n=1 Tax=Nocardioides bruguierae TaxID=2945102 RepID=A0A9X2D9T3_9ACTN|nr:hypothetical protein [Nocardioides bruguierae]MCM0621781.1 hypothetical protein [Nocardioides bruguierae]